MRAYPQELKYLILHDKCLTIARRADGISHRRLHHSTFFFSFFFFFFFIKKNFSLPLTGAYQVPK